MVGETALMGAASNFEQALAAFLVIVITGAILYLIKRIIDDNSKHNADILNLQRGFNEQFLCEMQNLISSMKEYKADTISEIRAYKSDTIAEVKGYHKDAVQLLHEHDEQAKCIKRLQEETFTTLKNRPCVAQNGNTKQ